MSEESKDEFAEKRSHEASRAAYELCKVIAQSCLLINGGAATAVLALLAKEKIAPSLLDWVPWALVGYALGVSASAYMLFCVMQMADNWNYYWYAIAYTKDDDVADRSEQCANWWHQHVYASFGLAIFFFWASSFIVAIAILRLPTT